MYSLNLERNLELFFSTRNLYDGDIASSMTPSNTWKVDVLSGGSVTASSTSETIQPFESGESPQRSSSTYSTAINPVEWAFSCYTRCTGAQIGYYADSSYPFSTESGNVKPLADWFLWQALIANTAPSSNTADQSVWSTDGRIDTYTTNSHLGWASGTSRIATAQENHLYYKLDNVVYQVVNAAVASGSFSTDISSISKTQWRGNGTSLRELVGNARNEAISVFGGTLNNGTSITANSTAANLQAEAFYHPFGVMNVAGSIESAGYIEDRLTELHIKHALTPGGTVTHYSFPITEFALGYTNNLSYLTPEEMSQVNTTLGQFTGAKTIVGSFAAYLRSSDAQTGQFLRNVVGDRRTSSKETTSLYAIVGGSTRPNVAFEMNSVHLGFPAVDPQEIVTIRGSFIAQPHSVDDELGISAQKYDTISTWLLYSNTYTDTGIWLDSSYFS